MKLTKEDKIELVAQKYREIMGILGIDMVSPHSQETHFRVAKYLVNEAFRALSEDPPEVKMFPAPDNVSPIVVRDIRFFSTCAHHHLPFYGTADIAYLPLLHIAGLSKFHRVVEYFAAKPQVQEELTDEIARFLFEKLNPVWIGVRMRATHMCVCARGVKNQGTTTTYAFFSEDSGMTFKYERFSFFLQLLRE